MIWQYIHLFFNEDTTFIGIKQIINKLTVHSVYENENQFQEEILVFYHKIQKMVVKKKKSVATSSTNFPPKMEILTFS
jgi:hypothetical protein